MFQRSVGFLAAHAVVARLRAERGLAERCAFQVERVNGGHVLVGFPKPERNRAAVCAVVASVRGWRVAMVYVNEGGWPIIALRCGARPHRSWCTPALAVLRVTDVLEHPGGWVRAMAVLRSEVRVTMARMRHAERAEGERRFVDALELAGFAVSAGGNAGSSRPKGPPSKGRLVPILALLATRV